MKREVGRLVNVRTLWDTSGREGRRREGSLCKCRYWACTCMCIRPGACVIERDAKLMLENSIA